MLIFFSFFSSFFSFLSSTAIIILPSPSELFSVNHSALFLLLKKKKKKKTSIGVWYLPDPTKKNYPFGT